MKTFYRSEDGAIAGVCKGLSETLEMNLGLMRLGFLISIFFGGTGFFVYLALAVSLPRKDKLSKAFEPRILGVCSLLARKFDIDIGLMRFLAVLSPLWSLGGSLLVYLLLKLFLPESSAKREVVRDLN